MRPLYLPDEGVPLGKPRLTMAEYHWLLAAFHTAKCADDAARADAFQTRWGGILTENDVLPLLRRGWLRRDPFSGPRMYTDNKLGERFRFILTEKALKVLFPPPAARPRLAETGG